MKPSELIGAAGATSLRLRLDAIAEDDGVARFLLDRLTGEQVAAITTALLKDPTTDLRLKIAIPRTLVAAYDLPEHVVTDERTVAIRNAECDKPALLLANTDDDQGASLQDVTLLGAKQLSKRMASADHIARTIGLDMARAGWQPTAANYLGRVTKPRILEAVREARGPARA